jgi:hypothetical protein
MTTIQSILRGGIRFVMLVAPLLALQLTPAYAQYPQIKIPVRISDVADSSNIVSWGVDPLATIGIDPSLGETELPPAPPVGGHDARFVGDSLEVGTDLDLRKFVSNAQTDTFRIRYQPSAHGGYPMKITWSKTTVQQYYLSSVRLVDDVGPGGLMLNVDMKAVDSVVITDTRFNIVRIVATGPLGPNEIRGTVFDDLLGDGVRSPSDTGLPGWRIVLGGDRADTATTDSAGGYVFRDLPNGNYMVSQELKSGWMLVTPTASYPVAAGGGSVFDNSDFGDFKLGSIAGFKFNDDNADGVLDGAEGYIQGWKLYLEGAAVESTSTDVGGQFAFTNVGPGSYRVLEEQSPNWYQTLPGAPGYYSATMQSGQTITGFGFGNKLANAFVGAPGGSWDDPGNWSFGHVPSAEEVVVVTVPLVIDALSSDTILGLRIGQGGGITYTIPDSLVVLHSIQIDSGGQLQFPPPPVAGWSGTRSALSTAQPHIICYGSWINNGAFDPGGSLNTMAGNDPGDIDASTFYDLEVRGDQKSSSGNIDVLNTLFLRTSFGLRGEDTLTVSDPAPDAIADTGRVLHGTLKRAIQEGETLPYRFSDPGTQVAFLPVGDLPDFMLVNCQADSNPRSFQLDWEIVGGTANPAAHTVAAESVGSFSKWALGGPKPGSAYGEPEVGRVYTISPEGGAGFQVNLSLAYDPAEVHPGVDESSLVLLRDPQIIGSIRRNWNLVSLPVVPSVTAAAELFPAAQTAAYRFDDGYISSPDLEFGVGYWMKFPADAAVGFDGPDIESAAIALIPGWNLIGAISFPVDVSGITTSPEGLIASQFYGYEGSYVIPDVLEPTHAYWVKAATGGSITMSAASAIAPKRPGTRPGPPDARTLTISDLAGREQVLYYDRHPRTDRQRYELPPVPPSGAFDARYATGYLLEAAGPGMSRTRIQVATTEYPITIRWEGDGGEAAARLVIGDREYSLERSGSATIADEGTGLELVLSGGDAVPSVFSLSQCYPNPFNPATTIEYSLPVRGQALLRVYNLLGEEVATLVDDVQDAGMHRITFDAHRLSSGAYFYRLDAGRATAVKKMLVIK